MQDWKEYEGRNVFVKLISNRVYQGMVFEVEFMGYDTFGVPLFLIFMKDKFDCTISFSNKEIKFLEMEPAR